MLNKLRRHTWKVVPARTPSGKTRMIRRCAHCRMLRYRVGHLTRYIAQDGETFDIQGSDETSCRDLAAGE